MVKSIVLSKDERMKLFQEIVTLGRRRIQTGALVNEADFLAGAMGVMSELGIELPLWPVLIMAGRSVLRSEDEMPISKAKYRNRKR